MTTNIVSRQHYTWEPVEFLLENAYHDRLHVTVIANVTGDKDSGWDADTVELYLPAAEAAAVVADIRNNHNPADYLDYCPAAEKEQALADLQQLKNELPTKGVRVPTALGWDVEYTMDALIDTMGIVLMLVFGIPCDLTSWVDADSVEHTDLTQDDIKGVAVAIAMFRLKVQRAINTARTDIRNASTKTAVQAAIDAFTAQVTNK